MKTVGILVSARDSRPNGLPFANSKQISAFSREGVKAGITMIVFTTRDIDWPLFRIRGYVFDMRKRRWTSGQYAMPKLIYDQYFHRAANVDAILQWRHRHKLMSDPRVRFISRGLNGKFAVRAALGRDPGLAPHLPGTELYTGLKTLMPYLHTHRTAVMKPDAGSQGKGLLFLNQSGEHAFRIRGFDLKGRPVSEEAHSLNNLTVRITRIIGKSPYLVQPWLALRTHESDIYDLRVYMQKNGKGEWRRIGSAIRRAATGRFAANLHAGGIAEQPLPFLTRQFGASRAVELLVSIYALCERIPACLEASYGRLFELGIDVGIEENGQFWFLEVNSKPGRTIFRQLGARKARWQTIRNLIEYARNILDRQLGG